MMKLDSQVGLESGLLSGREELVAAQLKLMMVVLLAKLVHF